MAEKKGFFKKMFEKLDKKMEDKANNSCCCNSDSDDSCTK
jgi:hypothetical protein